MSTAAGRSQSDGEQGPEGLSLHIRRIGRISLVVAATSVALLALAPARSPAKSVLPAIRDVSNTPGYAEGEEAVAVNPRNPRDLIVGSNQWQPLTSSNAGNIPLAPSGVTTCGVWSSHDGGRTWSGGAINAAGESPVVVPPQVAQQPILDSLVPSEFEQPGNLISADQNTVFDRHGVAYYQCIFSGARTGDVIVYVFRSTDGGRAWSKPVAAFSELNTRIQLDRSFLAIDDSGGPRDGTLYLGFETMFYQAYQPQVYVRASTDHGQTWGQIVRVDTDQNEAQWDPRQYPVVGPDGTLYVVYDAAQFRSPAPQDPGLTPLKIMVGSSRDGGRTFTDRIVEPNVHRISSPDEAEPDFTEEIAAIAADPRRAGWLVVAWPDNRSGAARILLRYSRNGGRSWSAIVDVSDDPVGDGNQHDHVALTYLPDGRLVVVWRGRRYTGGSFGDRFDVFARVVSFDRRGQLHKGSTVRVTASSQSPTTSSRGEMPSEYLGAVGSANGLSVSWDQMHGTFPDDVYRLIPTLAFGAPSRLRRAR
jgi:hypothetical protein